MLFIMLTGNTKGKKLQKSSGCHTLLVSKEAVNELKLKPQSEDCKLVEIVDKKRNRLIFQVIRA